MLNPIRLLSLLALLLFSGSVLAYPLVTIKNNSEYTASGTVVYADLGFIGVSFCTNDSYSVAPGKTWTAPSRGQCLVTSITGSLAGPSKYGEDLGVVRYTSSGTGYAKFRLQAFGDSYRIFSESEWAKESDNKRDKSPGFYFVNETDWPIAFSLDQAGCLYYGIVPKGGSVKRDTGSFWFTLRVHIQPDGINPQTDWDCAEPVVDIVVSVAIGALTGGAGAPAAAAMKVVAKAAVKSAVKAAAKAVAKNAVKQMMETMIDLSGKVTMAGQFSGYEWPFQCANMPTYVISNGPGVTKNSLGDIFLHGGEALTVTKVNSCGNDMMLASLKTASATQPFVPPTTLVETLEPGPPEPVPADLVLQRAALLALYNSTRGDNWFRSAGWLVGTGTECTWVGIVCNAQGRVTSIDLPGNNLDGALPSQIGDLTNLLYLDLGSNKLTGTLPSSIGNLTTLNFLDLSKNLFSGALPTSLGNLVNLGALLLSDNGFTGPVPSQLGNLSGLSSLTLANNQFTGSLPQEISDLNISELTFDSALLPLSAAIDQDDGGFKFSFSNTTGSVGGSVTGIVMGLVDNQRDQQATSIILTSWPAGLQGIVPNREVTQWTSQLSNQFDVVDGEIVSATFVAQDVTGAPGSGNFSTFVLNGPLFTNCCGDVDNGLSFDNNNTLTGNRDGFDSLQFGLLLPPMKFSFSNQQGNVAGDITGIIRGLANNWANQSATSIELTSWPAGLAGNVPAELDVVKWEGTYQNNFSVTDETIVAATVASIQAGRAFMIESTLNTNCCGNINNLLTFDSGATVTGVIAGTAGITFGAVLPPFRFSFENVQGNVPGIVSGVIKGLVDNEAGQAATSIELLSWPDGLLGIIPEELDVTNWSGAFVNSFNVANGNIVDAFVLSQEPGRAFSIHQTLNSSCCGTINNVLTFDSSATATGLVAGFPGVAYAQMSEPFKLTIRNLEGNVDGSVSAIIRGLARDQRGQAAASVVLTNWPDALEGNTDVDLDTAAWTIAATNSFDVVDGNVVAARFSGQEPGRAFYLNAIINSNCCGRMSNLLTFNSGGTAIGNTLGIEGYSIAPLLSTATLVDPEAGRVLPELERAALLALYESTNGDDWFNNSGWLDRGGSECEWFGISCENGRVTGIELPNNQLSGQIPWQLDDLFYLEILNLENNQLTGVIPWELGTPQFLRVLNLRNNQLTGAIPEELGNLLNLEVLNLRNNQLEGPLPDTLGGLTKLIELWLDGNQLNGALPDVFDGLSNLNILTLKNNQFQGKLPPSLQRIRVPNINFDELLTPDPRIFMSTFEETDFLRHRWSFSNNSEDPVGGAHAILINGAAVEDGSVTLDGVDQYIELPIQSTLASATNLTIEAWLTAQNVPFWARIFDFGTGTQVNFFAAVRGAAGTVGVAITTNGFQEEEQLNGPAPLPTGVITHFAMTLNAQSDTAVLYINGTPVDTATWTLTPEALGPLTNIWLGRSQYDDPYLDGSYHEVRIYDQALGEEIIAASFVAGPDSLQ